MTEWRDIYAEQNLRLTQKMLDQQSKINKLAAEITTAETRGYQQAINALANLLGYHLNPTSDPCQNRGTKWPCDVTQALTELTTRKDTT